MSFLQRVTREGIAPDISRPDPAKVLAGYSSTAHGTLKKWDGLYCGLWQSTPGKRRISYAEWEYVYIHSGHSILTAADGSATHLRAGDRDIIRPGLTGTWEVLETTLKDYVIRS